MAEEENNREQGYDSGVENVTADDLYKDTPVFDVSNKEFFNNMRLDRNRMRFKNGSKPSQFMQQSKYKKPFYMRYNDGKQSYLKQVK